MDGLVNKRPRFTPMTLQEALSGKDIPRAIRRTQVLLDVEHIDFDGKTRDGQLVLHRDLQKDAAAIFAELYKREFPINKIVPASAYENWDDDESMLDNNTHAFNYRVIAGTNRLSNHAFGRAIDINPMQNPHIKNGIITPAGATYDPTKPGTFVEGSPEVCFIKRRRLFWGRDWRDPEDNMHFERP